ncbi:MAG: hypothetical protein Q9227_005223 [Pyrenula ochraceoflavens]
MERDADVEQYGRRLLPSILDAVAKDDPERTFTSIARSDRLEDGFRKVSFSQLAETVGYVAHKLKSRFGTSIAGSDTLTYMGVPDLRYNLVFHAAVKCGYKLTSSKIFLPSPRNPAHINISLMEQMGCTKMLHSEELLPAVKEICGEKPNYECLQMEPINELLEHRSEPFEWSRSFEEAKNDPILVLHSSGSTGYPKPVISTHSSFAVIDYDHQFPGVPGRINNDFSLWDFKFPGAVMYDAFPPFHLAGFAAKIVIPLFFNVSNVFGPPLRPPSGPLVVEIMHRLGVNGAYLPPVIVEQIFQQPNGIETLRNLDVLCYAGGPLSPAVGDELAKSCLICQFYGSTEVGQVRQLVPKKEDWSYMEFNPNNRMEFQPDDDGAFELVLFADDTTEASCALNHNLPGVYEWRTKDLFRPHPTKAGTWKFHGRKDDVLVFSSGEKLNPLPMEILLAGQDAIAGVIMVGRGYDRPALLLEPKKNDEDPRTFVDGIWGAIEEGNDLMPSFGRILYSFVIVAKPSKPFIRAGKGTVVRRLTEAAYADEIEAHLKFLGPSITPRGSTKPELTVATNGSLLQTSKDFIRACMQQVAPKFSLTDQGNFYTFGLDSLVTAELVSLLRSGLARHRQDFNLSWLSADTIYTNPSVESLGRILAAFLQHGSPPEQRRNRVAEMQSMLDFYTDALPSAQTLTERPPKSQGITVLLTGSTGWLGKVFLTRLIKSPVISAVICLDRSAQALLKWQAYCADHPVKLGNVGKSIKFITVRFGEPRLGLTPENFDALAKEFDVLVHNAWKVDFNQSLSSYADNLQSVRTLIDLSLKEGRNNRFVFISSISSCGPWGPTHTVIGSRVPEAPIGNLDAAIADMGYGESKQVAENMLQRASEQSGLPITVIRPGQIAAPSLPSKEGWPGQELIPGIVQTSKSLDMVPSDYHEVDWVPIDHLSSIVLELIISDLQATPRELASYYNVVHPRPTPWLEIARSIQQFCGRATKLVPIAQWTARLKDMNSQGSTDFQRLPALKTLRFFETFAQRGPVARYDRARALAASRTMVSMGPITPEWMTAYLGMNS